MRGTEEGGKRVMMELWPDFGKWRHWLDVKKRKSSILKIVVLAPENRNFKEVISSASINL